MDKYFENEYGSLPDGEMKSMCDEMCKDKTVDELQKISDYFNHKASKLRQEMNENITMEDFEKFTKRNSSEEGDNQ